MRPLTSEDEAVLRAIAERHGFYAARGPHTGEGSASRLIDDVARRRGRHARPQPRRPSPPRRLARRDAAP